jgi:hypothetical protein
MRSGKRSIRATGISNSPHPIIIGHNCGYLGYDKTPYSRAATMAAYKDCDYLEIDLGLKKVGGEKKWWYYHPGVRGVCKAGKEGNREGGVSFDDFLIEFNEAAEESDRELAPNKRKLRPGLFLDLKKKLSLDEVKDLIKTLNKGYQDEIIPERTPLMIFTGRGWIANIRGVYRDTTRYFVKTLYDYSIREEEIMKHRFCPRLTLVTREVTTDQLIKGGYPDILGDSALKNDEQTWLKQSLKDGTLAWAFNPELFWLFKYDFKYIIEHEITVIPWFETNISKFRKFLDRKNLPEEEPAEEMARVPKKLQETDGGWIKVILGVLGEFWLYKSRYRKDVKPLRWGIITNAPRELKNGLQKWSFRGIR